MVVVAILTAMLSGCNSVNNAAKNSPSNADIEGNWEIVATSTTNPGVVSVMDVTLTSNVGPFGSFSGAGWSFQGQPTFNPHDCQNVLIVDQNDPLALTTSGTQVTGTFTDGTAVYSITGQVSGQGTVNVQFSGTYSSATGNSTTCQGNGTFIATQAVSLTGNYLGTSGFLTGATLSVTQSGGNGGPVGHSVTAVLSVAGTYSGSSSGNTAVLTTTPSGDTFYIWWDASAKTLWFWNSIDGVSGFTKQ
jgi:hypothetical protein